MMERLIAAGERAARDAQTSMIENVTRHLRTMLGDGAVEAGDTQVLVRRRGIAKRWLVEPGLRFLSRGLK